MCWIQRFSFTCLGVFLLASSAGAQPQKGAGSANPAASGGGQQSPTSSTSSPSTSGGGGLTGLSYARDDWNRLLSQPPNYQTLGLKKPEDLVFVCFRMVPGQSANQPFILEPDSPPNPWHKGSFYTIGQAVAPTNSNGHYYQASLTIMSGSSAPSFKTDGTDTADANQLKWADMGLGNEGFLQTVAPWTHDYSYEEGKFVQATPANGHYYRAVFTEGKQAGNTVPAWKTNGSPTADKDGLIWIDLGAGVSNPHIKANCRNISPTQPLLMDQILGVAIDTSSIPDRVADRFKVLNLNITNQQGASLNPTPIRPSLTAGAASGAEIAGLDSGTLRKAYYITWPNQMPGDTIPTVSVNLVYTPVAPGLPWTIQTFYPAGSIVAPNNPKNKNGHYYVALNSGISADDLPSFDQHVIALTTVPDKKGSGLSWKDMGLTPPTANRPPPFRQMEAVSQTDLSWFGRIWV